jgi:hypothetical protein
MIVSDPIINADLLESHSWQDIEDELEGKRSNHGFEKPYQVTLTYDALTRKITLTPVNLTDFSFWVDGKEITINGALVSEAHNNITSEYFFTINYLRTNKCFFFSVESIRQKSNSCMFSLL